jgi:molybdenum-dependent DNA-binding transcriptional regulator ModE
MTDAPRIPSELTLRSLRVFVALEETGSIAGAALRIGGSSSGVSQHITALEAAIGAKLFDRRAKPVTLTPAGQVLRAHAHRILSVVSEAQAELAEHLAILKGQGGDALIVIRDFLTHSVRGDIVRLAHASGISVVAEQKLFVESGALMSYGPDIPDLFRRAGGHVARIVRGTAPGDIPIEFPIRFELALNLNTARSFGIAIPQTILARADEVIE